MGISYDPDKNQRNLDKRDLGFDKVANLDWDSAWIFEDERNEYNEIRYIAYSFLNGRLHFVCFTETSDGIRVISFRKANNREVKRYE
ncbi:MAG: BrnT family toxin [Methylococcales symbiont of Hymedesmia sp. n. MRB-2018]|nr:MAG: BrnT family toxin [Methylococcales symbiont of Hymedesmia sp. n. MRB-2018]